MIALQTTSLMVTSWHDCWFQVARSVPSGDHFLQADFPLLIVVSERKITSEWPTIRADQLRRNIRKPADLRRHVRGPDSREGRFTLVAPGVGASARNQWTG
jgi:hypothetical protein